MKVIEKRFIGSSVRKSATHPFAYHTQDGASGNDVVKCSVDEFSVEYSKRVTRRLERSSTGSSITPSTDSSSSSGGEDTAPIAQTTGLSSDGHHHNFNVNEIRDHDDLNNNFVAVNIDDIHNSKQVISGVGNETKFIGPKWESSCQGHKSLDNYPPPSHHQEGSHHPPHAVSNSEAPHSPPVYIQQVPNNGNAIAVQHSPPPPNATTAAALVAAAAHQAQQQCNSYAALIAANHHQHTLQSPYLHSDPQSAAFVAAAATAASQTSSYLAALAAHHGPALQVSGGGNPLPPPHQAVLPGQPPQWSPSVAAAAAAAYSAYAAAALKDVSPHTSLASTYIPPTNHHLMTNPCTNPLLMQGDDLNHISLNHSQPQTIIHHQRTRISSNPVAGGGVPVCIASSPMDNHPHFAASLVHQQQAPARYRSISTCYPAGAALHPLSDNGSGIALNGGSASHLPSHVISAPPHLIQHAPAAVAADQPRSKRVSSSNSPPSTSSSSSSSSSNRSQFLEDFRNNLLPDATLRDLAGYVVEFSKDQHGSRFIQQKLETASPSEKDMIFQEICTSVHTLMTDVFGNYVIQKFLDFGGPEHKLSLIEKVQDDVFSLSTHMYGCRVVQKSLESLSGEDRNVILKQLENEVVRCVKDQHGNHVIQKCIECVDHKQVQFIIDSFIGQVSNLSIHPYGCRVIQRIMEHCGRDQVDVILSEVFLDLHRLIQDQYGNYVVQHVLQHGRPEDKSVIVNSVIGGVVNLSQHKFASNVVEKCIQYSERDKRTQLIEEVFVGTFQDASNPQMTITSLEVMVRDQYANYVIQKMMDVAEPSQRKALMTGIRPHTSTLRRLNYGKNIIAKLEKYFAYKYNNGLQQQNQNSLPLATSTTHTQQQGGPQQVNVANAVANFQHQQALLAAAISTNGIYGSNVLIPVTSTTSAMLNSPPQHHHFPAAGNGLIHAPLGGNPVTPNGTVLAPNHVQLRRPFFPPPHQFQHGFIPTHLPTTTSTFHHLQNSGNYNNGMP